MPHAHRTDMLDSVAPIITLHGTKFPHAEGIVQHVVSIPAHCSMNRQHGMSRFTSAPFITVDNKQYEAILTDLGLMCPAAGTLDDPHLPLPHHST